MIDSFIPTPEDGLSSSSPTASGLSATRLLERADFASLDALIAAAPEASLCSLVATAPALLGTRILKRTGVPEHYREPWAMPASGLWRRACDRITQRCREGGALIGLLGNRGTGKTRLACEVMRAMAPRFGHYTTAMALFLRLRAACRGDTPESEHSITHELASAPLLILDEIQERGETEWEDRVLTHLIDRRYGARLPTLLLANLTTEAFIAQVGESIYSRMQETGGVMELRGESYRGRSGRDE